MNIRSAQEFCHTQTTDLRRVSWPAAHLGDNEPRYGCSGEMLRAPVVLAQPAIYNIFGHRTRSWPNKVVKPQNLSRGLGMEILDQLRSIRSFHQLIPRVQTTTRMFFGVTANSVEVTDMVSVRGPSPCWHVCRSFSRQFAEV